MRATAVVEVRAAGNRSRYQTLRSDPPLLLRPTPAGLYLVGGAAGPLGGDRLDCRISVGEAASLVMRSSAASVVLPGPEPSSMRVSASVDEGGGLCWAPAPTITVADSSHESSAVVDLAAGAVLRWRDDVVLGRSGEGPGTLRATLRVVRDHRVLAHHSLHLNDELAGWDDGAAGWDGPAGIGGAGAVITELLVGPGDHRTRTHRCGDSRAGVFELAPDASLRTALGPDWHSASDCLSALTQ
ncbi:MAG: urease accessory protein UreD [bacterium]|nr:urease accessory protein UreD [bacterium]MCY4273435.1 urease accessory protein UreD [bacterium]